MAILSILVFGAGLAAAVYALVATVRPELARIIDLLANGPIATTTQPAPVPARSTLRNVTVRGVSPTPRATQRAAA